jgi:L-threonylcarbamoyladenylate synthase
MPLEFPLKTLDPNAPKSIDGAAKMGEKPAMVSSHAPLPKTTILLNGQNIDDLAHAAELLRASKVVAIPTETVYGLAGNAGCEEAVRAIFLSKGRPQDNPLILHSPSVGKAELLFDFTKAQSSKTQARFELLSQRFWPGPLTIIAPKSSLVSNLVSARLDTVAVRVPKDPVARTLLKMLPFPLAMPSANLSKRPSPTDHTQVLKTLDGRIDAVVTSGKCAIGVESTVVRIDQDEVYLLRPGSISRSAIELCLNEAVRHEKENAALKACSPGMNHQHYAPLVEKILWGDDANIAHHWTRTTSFMGRQIELCDLTKKLGPRPPEALTIVLGNTPVDFNQELFHGMYLAEERALEALVIVPPKEQGDEWCASLDRLSRSAEVPG